MGFDNWFPIIVGIIVFFFMYIKPLWDQYKDSKDPEKKAKPNALKDFLKKVEAEMQKSGEEEGYLPPPPPLPKKFKKMPVPKKEEHQAVYRDRPKGNPIHEKSRYTSDRTPDHLYDIHYRGEEMEVDAYQAVRQRKLSRAQRLFGQLPSKKNMLLYQIILGPPKSLE